VNSLPGVTEMLALLDALKANVREFAAREEKLEADFRVSTAAELRDYGARNEAQEASAYERQVNAAAALKTEQDACQLRLVRRKDWINRAHAAVSRRVLDEISTQDVQWKERTQQGVQEAEQRRNEALAAAGAAHEDLDSGGTRRTRNWPGSRLRPAARFAGTRDSCGCSQPANPRRNRTRLRTSMSFSPPARSCGKRPKASWCGSGKPPCP